MKRLYQLCLTGMVAACMTLCYQSKSQNISSTYFGENAWMPDTIGNAKACSDPPCLLNGKLHKHWKDIMNCKASVIRFGGITADRNRPTNFQYIKMIDSIRSRGMEPMIQVPFFNYKHTAPQAADIVKYVNITKGRKIKYWIIGNEPNLSYNFTSAAQVAAYIKPFASAMKAIDPAIIIIGPEVAWYDLNILKGLLTPNGASDITGKDNNGNYYVDVISFHTYPFNGSQTRSQVITKLTSSGSLQDNLVNLNSMVSACNTAHNRTGASALQTGITEANINWQNSSSDNLNGLGVNSFIGGQFIAEMMGIGLKHGLDFINIWSVVEGNSTALNIGLIDPSGKLKPSYYHFKMMAESFKGNYVSTALNQANVKSFASSDGQKITVMLMNQDLSTNFNFTLRLNTNAITSNNALKINVSANILNDYSGVLENQSTLVLTFNSSGALVRKCEYSLSTHAIANIAPTCTDFITTDVMVNNDPEEGDFEINAFPNPTGGSFTIQLSDANPNAKRYEVSMVNLLGQEVFAKKADFVRGREDIELKETTANGIYIVTVKEGDKTKQQKLMIQR